ncbi:MAG: lysylphosphatidylglycerol synthase transmembrane domain-containing protein [Bacteroidia bacterium]|nr:lysylphosphatidylglycerol synthase transmembrane domain-containing protein [Bacteroidia bacterium]
MKKKIFSILKFLFFLGVGILLIWLAVRNLTEEDKASIAEAFTQANYYWIALSMLLSFLSHWIRAMRWRLLIQPLGFNPKLSNTFFALMVGYLANFALPRLGEISRCGVLTKYEKIPFTEGFGTVIAERAIDVLCLILIFIGTLFFQFDELWGLTNDKIISPLNTKFSSLMDSNIFLSIFALIMVGVTISFFIFRKRSKGMFSKKLKEMALGFWEGLKSVKNIKRPILFIFHTILIWFLYTALLYVGFFCFAETSYLSFGAALAIMLFGSLGIAFVPGGTGAYQALVTETLTSAYKTTFTFAFAFSWLIWTSQFALILLLGVISLIMLPIINKEVKL